MGMTQKPSNSRLGGGAHHLPCPQERYVCSNAVSMLIGFFETRGVVHYEFVPHEQIVNSITTLTPCSGWGKCEEKMYYDIK